jgi:LemA protein
MDNMTDQSFKDNDELLIPELSSGSFDSVLFDQILARKRRRYFKRAFLILATLFTMVGALYLTSPFLSPPQGPTALQQLAATRLQGKELNSEISALEMRLHKPGQTLDYFILGEAYNRRFALSRQSIDAARAAENFHRADELVRKQLTEVSMNQKAILFTVIPLLCLLGILAFIALLSFNGLATRDEQVDARWGQVESVLQRRLDLIPQLVETVRGYASHEERTFTNVINARSKLADALANKLATSSPEDRVRQVGLADNEFQSALRGLSVVIEKYPVLKANSNFLTLQEQLEGTENRINTERLRFNEAVRDYNTTLRRFPGNVTGALFGFDARAYFEAKGEAHTPPSFSFGSGQK